MSASIRNAIDSIIANYLPLKFAHHGFLSYQDVTNKSLFFAIRGAFNVYKAKSSFPNFDKGISNKTNKLTTEAVYYFNLPPPMRSQSMEGLLLTARYAITRKRHFSRVGRHCEGADRAHCMRIVTRLYCLGKSPRHELAILGWVRCACPTKPGPPKPVPMFLGPFRIRTPGTTSVIMRKPTPGTVVYFYFTKTLTTNIHPIGRLVVGHKFERAVLYKVLADALGVRCWLRRGTGQTASIAWVEVNVEPPNSKNPQQAEELKPNHLIDLMSAEPRLLPIGSKEARQYTKLLD
ncbi:unnamed protein product [Nesidiocoris tenuis]|uniref:EDR1/CTR1/ARMC3-like peptidase-like domain-containing protein n=1 Tax=Nesidiocoris tenuis TaxID=355587 RepID=A0A6H5FXW4_9HEMI|nr:unnamed protein product [Nesidiocoris tenuis]